MISYCKTYRLGSFEPYFAKKQPKNGPQNLTNSIFGADFFSKTNFFVEVFKNRKRRYLCVVLLVAVLNVEI